MSRLKPRFVRQNPKLPVPVNNVYRAKVIGSIEGQMTVNTFFYRDEDALGTILPLNLVNFANSLIAAGAVVAKLVATCSSDWELTEIIVDSPTAPSLASFSKPLTGNGGGPAGHEPTEVGMPVIRVTGFKGQCARGRITTPAVPTAWVTGSALTTQAAHVSLATQMLLTSSSAGQTFHPGLFSRDGSHAFPGLGYADLSNAYLANASLLGTIRRRKIGRGK